MPVVGNLNPTLADVAKRLDPESSRFLDSFRQAEPCLV